MTETRKLELTKAEELRFSEDRGLTADPFGNRILAGLTVEESIWYVEWSRQRLAERMDPEVPRSAYRTREEFLELHERHERARMQIVMAEHQLEVDTPTEH